jgi:predicted metal-dependent hydrolase
MRNNSLQKQIKIDDKIIDYTLKINRRAKHIRLAVYLNGDFVVTQPRYASARLVAQYIEEKADWILKQIESFKNSKPEPLSHLTRRDYLNNRAKARRLIIERLEYFNNIYKFKYNSVSIRDQKTRWGSCSKRGGLNFNYRLLYLSAEVRDYVIVHEICHLKEFNHSANFWKLVAQEIPNFRALRNKLKNGQLI